MSSNWLHKLVVPILVASVEASWAALWISALGTTNERHPADLPFLALAIPAVAAVVLGAETLRLKWPPWARDLATAPVIVVAAAISSGVIGSMFLHVPFAAVSFHPWSIAAGADSQHAALAWFVSAAAWARGTWLGRVEVTVRHAIWSGAISTVAFGAFIVIAAIHGNPAFHAQLGPAGASIFFAFVAAIGGVCTIHVANLERETMERRDARSSALSLGVVMAPALVVAGVAALFALAIGPLAPEVARIVKDGAVGVGDAIAWFARWIAHFFHASPSGHNSHTTAPKVKPSHLSHLKVKLPAPLYITVAAIAGAIGAVAIGLGLYLLIRSLLQTVRGRRISTDGPETTLVGADREFVFSWRHFFDQLAAALRRLFGRHRDGDVALGTSPSPGAILSLPADDTVRGYYRRVLLAARRTGEGRAPNETPTEFERRLMANPRRAEQAIHQVTLRYESVRYGEVSTDLDELETMRLEVTTLVESIESNPGGDVEPTTPAATP